MQSRKIVPCSESDSNSDFESDSSDDEVNYTESMIDREAAKAAAKSALCLSSDESDFDELIDDDDESDSLDIEESIIDHNSKKESVDSAAITAHKRGLLLAEKMSNSYRKTTQLLTRKTSDGDSDSDSSSESGSDTDSDSESNNEPDKYDISNDTSGYKTQIVETKQEDLTFEERLAAQKHGDNHSKTRNSKSKIQIRRERRFKREHKNRPREMTSKRAVGRHRDIVQVKKIEVRDPRFNSLSGIYNETHHRANFGFLDDYRKSETKTLARDLSKIKNKLYKKKLNNQEETEDEYQHRMSLQADLTRHQQQIKATAKNDELREQRQKWKRLQRKQISEGRNPYFPKKRELKEERLTQKFHELNKSGGIDKFLARKRQKHAQRDRKKMPRSMRG